MIAIMIFNGQVDLNMLLDPFNATQFANMTQMNMSQNLTQNMSGSTNLSSLFGF